MMGCPSVHALVVIFTDACYLRLHCIAGSKQAGYFLPVFPPYQNKSQSHTGKHERHGHNRPIIQLLSSR